MVKRSKAKSDGYPPRIADPQPGKKILGMPWRTKWRKGLLLQRLWDPRDDAILMPPKAYGIGWSLNFAYPLIRTKALWRRVLAFIVLLALLLVVLWVFISLVLIIYYLLTMSPAQPTLQYVFTPNGSIVPA